jgi:hypothetical protein
MSYLDISYEVCELDGKFHAVMRRDGKLLAYSKPWPTQQAAVDCIEKMVAEVRTEARRNGRNVEELLE